jgi:hypothetical protein
MVYLHPSGTTLGFATESVVPSQEDEFLGSLIGSKYPPYMVQVGANDPPSFFNGAAFIECTIRSVLRQNHRDVECIQRLKSLADRWADK